MAVFPSQSFTADNVKVRWDERYTSESLNIKFLGIPRGVYAGFRPQTTTGSLVLSLTPEPVDGYSLIRVQAGQEAVMIDIITQSTVTLDFTGQATWPVYVLANASYQVGSDTSAQLFTRATPAAGPTEVTVCKVDRPGNTGDLLITTQDGVTALSVFPTNDIVSRQEPYAFDDRTTLSLAGVSLTLPQVGDIITVGSTTGLVSLVSPGATSIQVVLVTNGPLTTGAATFQPSGATATVSAVGSISTGQRFGFMPKGAVEQVNVAYTTSQEVVAARTDLTGVAAPNFNPSTPQTTGLPARLTEDLRANSLSSRLGLKTINVPSNVYTMPNRTVNIVLTSAASFNIGDTVTSGSASGVIRAVSGTTITVHNTTSFIPFVSGSITDTTTSTTTTIATDANGNPAVYTALMNISGSFSAFRRAGLSNNPITDFTTTRLLASTGSAVINPSGTEVAFPSSSTNYPPVSGAITSTVSNTVILTVTNIKNSNGSFNSVDAFLPGEIVTGGSSGAKMVVSELRFPYLIGTAISGVTTAFVTETITGNITGATANATATFAGLLNDTTRNICYINRIDTGTRYTVPSKIASTTITDFSTSIIYGRIGLAVQDLLATGTFTFSNGSSSVATTANYFSGVSAVGGTSASGFGTGRLDIGDIIQAPDGRYYEIAGLGASNLVLHTAFIGNNNPPGPITVNSLLRRRFNANLVVRPTSTGTETPLGSTTFPGIPTTFNASLQVFFPTWLDSAGSEYDATSIMLGTGNFTDPDATTALKGQVLLAPNNAPGGLNTANDTKAGMIVNVQQTGTSVGPGNYHTINFITASGITAGAPGIINVASTGPVGPTGPTGPPGPSGGGGGAGPPGPGFSHQDYSFTIADLPNGAITGTHSYGFTVAFAWVGISSLSDSGGVPEDQLIGLSINPSANMITLGGTFNINDGQDTHIGVTVGAAG